MLVRVPRPGSIVAQFRFIFLVDTQELQRPGVDGGVSGPSSKVTGMRGEMILRANECLDLRLDLIAD